MPLGQGLEIGSKQGPGDTAPAAAQLVRRLHARVAMDGGRSGKLRQSGGSRPRGSRGALGWGGDESPGAAARSPGGALRGGPGLPLAQGWAAAAEGEFQPRRGAAGGFNPGPAATPRPRRAKGQRHPALPARIRQLPQRAAAAQRRDGAAAAAAAARALRQRRSGNLGRGGRPRASGPLRARPR